MIHDPPRFLVLSVKRTLEFESSQLIVGPNPRRSKLYNDILANLDVDTIPTERPFGRPQWLVIANALESISALVFLIMYSKDGLKAPPTAHRKIIDGTLPLVWRWLVFLHPDSAYFDEDELHEAIARYGWTRYAARAKDWVRVMISTYYNFMTHPADGGPAILAMPNAASHIFHLWYSRMVQFRPDEPSDHPTAELLQALTNLLFKNIPLAIQLKEEVLYSKGEGAIRKIIRRLRDNLCMENPEFLELSNLAEFLLAMAHAEDIRPLLRPMLWLAVPFMEMVHHPGAAAFHRNYIVAEGITDDSCIAFFTNGFLMLQRLSSQFRTVDDIIRIINAGLLRPVFHYSQRYGVPDGKVCLASQACNGIIGPALHFRTGLKAISEALDRDNLPRLVEGGFPGRDAWNTMCSLVEERLNWVGDFTRQTLTLQHCHNAACTRDWQELRRCPCGGAYYCSKTCQEADWPRHKADCDPGTVAAYHGFQFKRQSDIYYVQFCAARDAAQRLVSKDAEETLVVDYTCMEPEVKTCSCQECLQADRQGTVCVRVGTCSGITALRFSQESKLLT